MGLRKALELQLPASQQYTLWDQSVVTPKLFRPIYLHGQEASLGLVVGPVNVQDRDCKTAAVCGIPVASYQQTVSNTCQVYTGKILVSLLESRKNGVCVYCVVNYPCGLRLNWALL